MAKVLFLPPFTPPWLLTQTNGQGSLKIHEAKIQGMVCLCSFNYTETNWRIEWIYEVSKLSNDAFR